MGWSVPDKGAPHHRPSRRRKFQHPDVGWRPLIALSSRWRTALPMYGIYGKPVYPPKLERSREFLREFRRAPATKTSHRAQRPAPWPLQTWKSEETSGCSRSIWTMENQRDRWRGLPKPLPDETAPPFRATD